MEPDTVTLSGDQLARIRQTLRVAEHQVRVGQTGLPGRHLQDVLAEAEEAIADLLTRIRDAEEDDRDEAEDSGAAERKRRSWFPVYHAA